MAGRAIYEYTPYTSGWTVSDVLRKAGFGKQVKAAIKNIKQPTATALAKGIEATFKQKSDREWRDHIETEAKKRTLKV